MNDINLGYKCEYDQFYVSNYRMNKNFYTLNFHETADPISKIDLLLSENELVLLETRFDMLPMYACYHVSDKKEFTNHQILIVATDENYIYFVEDYYMIKNDTVWHFVFKSKKR